MYSFGILTVFDRRIKKFNLTGKLSMKKGTKLYILKDPGNFSSETFISISKNIVVSKMYHRQLKV